MGMSTSIQGFIPPDEKWKAYKDIYDKCKTLNIDAPQEVYDFFDGESPGNAPGKLVQITQAISKPTNDDGDSWDVTIAKLPKNVTVIRFRNDW
jgi:hypothetical protein